MNGVTSVKVHHAPGGKTSISLFGGYGDDDQDKNKKATGGAVGQAQPAEEEKKEAPAAGGAAGPKADAGKGVPTPQDGQAAAGGKAAVDANPHAIGAGAAPLTSVKYSGQPPGGKSSGPLW